MNLLPPRWGRDEIPHLIQVLLEVLQLQWIGAHLNAITEQQLMA